MLDGFEGKVRLMNRSYPKAMGICMDLNHAAAASYGSEIEFTAHSLSARNITSTADIIVLTAGLGLDLKTGIVDRNQLAFENARILIPLIKSITVSPKTVILIITNPVDNLTYLAVKALAGKGIPKEQVIGLGTMVESARYRSLLTKLYPLDKRSLCEFAFVLGEHGTTMVPILSQLKLPKLKDFLPDVTQLVENAAKSIRGSTMSGPKYCIASTAYEVIQNLLSPQKLDNRKFMTLSVFVENNLHYGLKDICISLPALVGPKGIEEIIDLDLSSDEFEALKHSSESLRNELKILKQSAIRHGASVEEERDLYKYIELLC
jgi:malate/lactate dehydrogenase